MISLRPSGAGRWVPCPASPRLEAPFPDVESEDAKEGTAAHWCAAQVLKGHHQLEELTDRAAPNGVIIDGEMVEHVDSYVRTVGPEPAVIERELPAAVPGTDPGTPDAFRIVGDVGFLWDFKYGYRIVEARGNWQLADYAVRIFAKHEWQLSVVVATIVQPRPFHPDGRVRSWTIGRDEAAALYHALGAAAGAAHDPAATASTGPHCDNCRALHVCEAARRAALNAVDVAHAGMAVQMDGTNLAGELRTLRRAVDAARLRLDAIESHAMSLIDGGHVVPGFRAERAFGRRRWVDPDKVAAIEAMTGLTLYERKPVSPAQAEKRGADESLVKLFTVTPETGRKLVERDGSAKAAEVFK